nr:uncharacterized protein LOC101241339 [Hydra vulgaris]
MLIGNESSRSIANATGLSIRTIQNWIRKLEADQNIIPKKRGRAARNNIERKREIELLINANNALTTNDMAELMPEEHKCSTTTIKRELKQMGYTRKRLKSIVVARNSAQVIATRFMFCNHVSFLRNLDLVYIDETGFNLHDSRHYGYALLGSTPFVTVPTQRGRNVSLICAISVTRCIGFKLKIGAFNTTSMHDWIEQDLRLVLSDRRYVVLMDNARFHHSSIVESAFRESNCTIQFLPPYSPQLNPIEKFFGVVKNLFKGIQPRPNNSQEMIRIITEILSGFTKYSFENYYSHMREWMLKGIQRNEFI